MPNDADLAAFLDRVPADGSTIGNGALRDALGWDESRYTAAKDALVANGTVLKGQGRGGTVRRATPVQQTSLVPSVAPALPPAKPRPQPAVSPAPQPKPADQSLSAFIWSVADLLRGDYKPHEYAKVILPFTVLRRLDCVLEPSKAAVLAELDKRSTAGLNPAPFLLKVSGLLFYNTSPLDLKRLMGDQDHIGENLRAYLQTFSPEVRDIFERFEIHTQIDRLAKANLLYLVTEKFATIDLHPEVVSNAQMGTVFEELIRKFAELSNETAGEHFTPREVIRLMVNLLFAEDDEALTKPGVVRSLYDPTAGTGGMLTVAGEHLAAHNPDARLVMYGQELNPESYAICKADMLIKGQDIANICFGNTLSADGLPGKHFDYMLSNPPFGVEWKKIEKEIRDEADKKGYNGRFGPGLPRVSDGSLLFLLHLISKMRPVADADLRDTENVPLGEDVEAYFQREVLPHAPDAWIDHDKTKVGYEIPFNRHFYVFKPPRPLAEIDAELKGVTDRILTMIAGLTR